MKRPPFSMGRCRPHSTTAKIATRPAALATISIMQNQLRLKASLACLTVFALVACGDSGTGGTGGTGGGGGPPSGGAPQGGQNAGGADGGSGGAGAGSIGGAGGGVVGGAGGDTNSAGGAGGNGTCVDNADCDKPLECCTSAETPTCYDPACLACCMGGV